MRTCQLAPKALDIVDAWLSKQRAMWERRLDQLDSFLNEMKEKVMMRSAPFSPDPELDLVLEQLVEVVKKEMQTN